MGAQAALQKAVESKDVAALRFALNQVRSLGIDDSLSQRAQKVLDEEEGKELARQQMSEAMKSRSIPMLEAAIAQALVAKLEGTLIEDAEKVLQKERAKENAL